MLPELSSAERQPEHASWFTATHWSVVLAARQSASPQTAEALEKLCRAYWHPLYAYVRRRGHAPHDAQDLTQEFFARLLEKNCLSAVDPRKGKFRSFLLAALEHFLANEWRRVHTQKRGGGATLLSLDETSAEGQYLQIAAPNLPPEKVFEQQWALTLLERVTAKLRQEFTAAGRERTFEELKVFLTGDRCAGSYAELAGRQATTEAALKMAVSRMRQRFGQILRAEIADTVSSPEEIEEELRALFAALGG